MWNWHWYMMEWSWWIIFINDFILDDSYLNMSSTQRLVVSCMSVLAVVSMLLFFSRNILQRRHGRTNTNLINWINRRGIWWHHTTPQYLLHSVHRLLNNIVSEDHLHSRNDEENYPGCNYPGPGSSDLPPPYVFVKPPDENAHVDGKSFVWKQYWALL